MFITIITPKGKEKRRCQGLPRPHLLSRMVKFYCFHQTAQEYYERGQENLFPELFGCPNPKCHYQGRLRRHGFYTRNVLTCRACFRIFVQRYYCKSCKRTVSLLPSFLLPYFQYSLACIFFCLFRIIITRLPLEQIALKINQISGRTELSHQQLVFYKKRFLGNMPLIIGFFGSKEFIFAKADLKSVIRRIFKAHFLEPFNLQYFQFQARHFLAKS